MGPMKYDFTSYNNTIAAFVPLLLMSIIRFSV